MPQKVAGAKIILQVAGGLSLATAAAAGFIFGTGAISLGLSGARRALFGSALLGGLGLAIAVASAAFGAAALIAASGIARRNSGSRALGRILAILLLPAVPVGPVLGAFVLIGLSGPEAKAWFEPGLLPRIYPG